MALGLLSGAQGAWADSHSDRQVRAAESYYADFLDAAGAVATIDSGLVANFGGLDRPRWQARYDGSLASVRAELDRISTAGLSPESRRAVEAMRSGIAWRTTSSLAPVASCSDARRPDATGSELRAALYACFSRIGDAIEFEGHTYSRLATLQLLEQLEDPQRRRALFMAMAPLWQAVDASNAPDSPYRRMLVAEAAQARATIRHAEESLGVPEGTGERWLEQALEAWRGPEQGASIEPWDFRYSYSGGARAVQACARNLQAANSRFFADLGADLTRLHVIQDVAARAGMAPVDYTDFARIGRRSGGTWRPAIPRVSVLLQSENLSEAGELAHESGHAVHFAAMRTRPALVFTDDMSMPIEAFADITGWSVYSPAWQRKYLGCASSDTDGARARLGFVMLDLAWGLFEIRMARAPDSDPNAVWTEITARYLHIVPHPEWSWWAVRGQLVDDPGYMINYALGAFVTADLRAHTRARIGDFDAGNPQWYRYLSEHLFRHGSELEPPVLFRQFLGRAISPEALLTEIRQLQDAR